MIKCQMYVFSVLHEYFERTFIQCSSGLMLFDNKLGLSSQFKISSNILYHGISKLLIRYKVSNVHVSDLKIELQDILKIFLFIINFASSAYQNSNLFYILQDSTSKNTLAWLKIVACSIVFFSMAFEDFFLLDTLEW